jgi:hypothetical protein
MHLQSAIAAVAHKDAGRKSQRAVAAFIGKV